MELETAEGSVDDEMLKRMLQELEAHGDDSDDELINESDDTSNSERTPPKGLSSPTTNGVSAAVIDVPSSASATTAPKDVPAASPRTHESADLSSAQLGALKEEDKETSAENTNDVPDVDESLPQDSEDVGDYKFIVAVDLGTKYSGYAFQSVAAESNTTGITPFTNWGGGAVYNNYKTPTCVLLRADGELEAFGQEAIDAYLEAQPEKQRTLLFFEQFKMKLYGEAREKNWLDKTLKISTYSGTKYPAIKVFSKVFEHFQKHFHRMIKVHISFEVKHSEVMWVITVPAIWDDAAKQFMREAAYIGGLVKRKNSPRLVLALESEAAALHCRTLPIAGFCDSDIRGNFAPPDRGMQYLVIDAGGGTVDITAHEIISKTQVKEISKAMGGAFGGTQVDEMFMQLLERVVGADFLAMVKKDYSQELLQVMHSFEDAKRKSGFKSEFGKKSDKEVSTSVQLKTPLPYDFCTMFRQHKNIEDMKDYLAQHSEKGVSWKGGQLLLDGNKVRELFDPVVKGVVDTIKKVMSTLEVHKVQVFYLVGGFSDCAYLRRTIAEAFPKVRVLVPTVAGLAVVQGAVRFANDQSVVAERMMKYSYGTDVIVDFDPNKHPENKKRTLEGKDKCVGVFNTFIKAGQLITYNETIEYVYTPTDRSAIEFIADIYASPQSEVEYVDDEGCFKAGSVRVQLPPHPASVIMARTCKLKISFSRSEIKVVAIDESTKKSSMTTLNFLES